MPRERTERAIMRTFLELLNQYPLDKITVKDIVTACSISRNTFYYHYQDIYDLLGATFDAVAERVLQEDATTWQESLRSCTRFALENRRAVYHVYRSAYREQLERYLYRVTEERMDHLIRHLTADMPIPEEDIHYLTLFYKCAITGILLEWLNADMKGDVDHLISRMGTLLEGNLRLSLERTETENNLPLGEGGPRSGG